MGTGGLRFRLANESISMLAEISQWPRRIGIDLHVIESGIVPLAAIFCNELMPLPNPVKLVDNPAHRKAD